MKCPMPLLDRHYTDEPICNEYEPFWRPCGEDLYVMVDRGAGTVESPLDWYQESWKVECGHGHVLLMAYDDTNGPVISLQEASEPKNWIAIGIEGLTQHLDSLLQSAIADIGG